MINLFLFDSLDDVVSLTVGGKTLISFREPNPFPINYFAIATKIGGDILINHNCKANINVSKFLLWPYVIIFYIRLYIIYILFVAATRCVPGHNQEGRGLKSESNSLPSNSFVIPLSSLHTLEKT